ncbi:hypothetical protein MDA_GLEAN10005424 [Myotis davidii]|uniref:Uncharacterized protein n=1 Tax=Myotis davidii TaxID=225400 RepID=L5LHC3_MYODS|nr:hypothetical protein MDA_GLEAN10005424 [Myotis davidii]
MRSPPGGVGHSGMVEQVSEGARPRWVIGHCHQGEPLVITENSHLARTRCWHRSRCSHPLPVLAALAPAASAEAATRTYCWHPALVLIAWHRQQVQEGLSQSARKSSGCRSRAVGREGTGDHGRKGWAGAQRMGRDPPLCPPQPRGPQFLSRPHALVSIQVKILRKMRASVERIKLRKSTEKAEAGGENQNQEPGMESKETASSTHLAPGDSLLGGPGESSANGTASAAATTPLAAPLFCTMAAESTSSSVPWGLGSCTVWSSELPQVFPATFQDLQEAPSHIFSHVHQGSVFFHHSFKSPQ